MPMRPASFLLLLLSASIAAHHAAVQADDEAALLVFKAAAIHGGYGDALASWNGSSSSGGFCSWEGVTCGKRHRRVVALSLPSHKLTGVLSPAIGNLTFLRTLNLSKNGFDGSIPASIGRLRRLRVLDLDYNGFSGELPGNLSSCTSLKVVNIQYNHLHGRVPWELGDKLVHLERLDLFNNNLTGTIPASLGNLSSLTVLDFGFNHLEGTITPELGGIRGLQWLTLGYNNLSGELPRSLLNLSSLVALQVQGNTLHGEIPVDIGSNFPNIKILSFGENQLTGPIPDSLSNLTTLRVLTLITNRLSGHVPRTIGRLRALERLSLHRNLLEANDTEGWEFIASLSNCTQLQSFTISNNIGFTGKLPASIVNLSTTMEGLMLADTGIVGSIPSAIGNLFNLQFFSVANTSISGEIPDSIGKLVNLVQLGLYNTHLSGLIPPSIGNLSKLTALAVFNTNLEGPIPKSIGRLKNLYAIDMKRNRFNGSIPMEIFKLPLLSRYLSLSYNLLSGPLPFEIGSLRNLNVLGLSGNRLSGEIPDSIGECTVLQTLWLDNNLFEGRIPQSLQKIKGLSILDLSMNKLSGVIPEGLGSNRDLRQLSLAHNNLSGTIPKALQNLTLLSELDLSFNNLQGEVPKDGIFKNLANLSITGNNDLCGGMPQLHLAPCHMNAAKSNIKGKLKSLTIVLATTGALLLLAFAILSHSIIKKLRRRQTSPFPPPKIEDHYERVSYHTLANGTNGFSEANLLGKGSFGEVYKCTFQDEGTTVAAVKVFNLEQSRSIKSFVVECEALRRVRHRCLVKLITCCSSINQQGQEFKALVFEFMPNGSLNDWLHPKFGMPTLRNTLSLEQRLNIAVDIIDALDYLHNHCQPPIIHCDLKPSNILLAEDMSARVGDFGISRILQESASNTVQNSNSTIGIQGSIGYVAPGNWNMFFLFLFIIHGSYMNME
jgi:Leucine-rich repeat (LRR) protein